ncbi:MaoC family dehydratase [Nocardia sp. NPDC057272]|uniref:MaoC family dehydratase n=1 Tax=Nocardia sp. NPDC057272 TaxID=3346079 RepID=UPI003632711C
MTESYEVPTTTSIVGLESFVGQHLGTSEWLEVTQSRVDTFADATDDHQWIHVDPERAARESPFGGPVAHGYLTLSLLPYLLPQVLAVTDAVVGVNYGLNKVRFPGPVPIGAKVRLSATLQSVDRVRGGVQVTIAAVVEISGAAKPACIAEPVYRYLQQI